MKQQRWREPRIPSDVIIIARLFRPSRKCCSAFISSITGRNQPPSGRRSVFRAVFTNPLNFVVLKVEGFFSVCSSETFTGRFLVSSQLQLEACDSFFTSKIDPQIHLQTFFFYRISAFCAVCRQEALKFLHSRLLFLSKSHRFGNLSCLADASCFRKTSMSS